MNETERTAVELAVRYEQSQARTVTYVDHGWPAGLLNQCREWARSRHPGAGRLTCDLVSQNPDGTIARLIEVKGRGGRVTSVSIFDRQRDAMLGLGADWWLYVALDCRTDPVLVRVREPARLPWKLLTPPAALAPGQRCRRVDQEGIWHVMPQDILEAAGD